MALDFHWRSSTCTLGNTVHFFAIIAWRTPFPYLSLSQFFLDGFGVGCQEDILLFILGISRNAERHIQNFTEFGYAFPS